MSLAYNMRPKTLDEFVGQEHLTGKGKIIERIIETRNIYSMIFWGPPGSGKTTLAHIIANSVNADFHKLEAVSGGKKIFLDIVKIAQENKNKKIPTVLFIDEIHRWNKAQQDTLLPYIENGLITLIGATTENPSFEITNALRSRVKIFILKNLENEDLRKILHKALTDNNNGIGNKKLKIDSETEDFLISLSQGDARIMLNGIEIASETILGKSQEITKEIIKEAFQAKSNGLYDKNTEEHHNIISAFIKSMRGSDTDAALYYMIRMLENGEDPKFIARRMIIFASEDIGMADRGALIQANEAFEAVERIGMPEGYLTLTHVVIYLSKAPKSRKVANALDRAKTLFAEYPNESIPLHLRNATTKFNKSIGYAKNYTWSKKYVGPKKELPFLPEKLSGKKIYEE